MNNRRMTFSFFLFHPICYLVIIPDYMKYSDGSSTFDTERRRIDLQMTDTNISLRESILVTDRRCTLQCKCQGRATLVFIETHSVAFLFYH